MNKKLFDRSEDHQHFGLRKLTIGVASVLLGTTFMVYGGQTVHADTASDTSLKLRQKKYKTKMVKVLKVKTSNQLFNKQLKSKHQL